ncbi:MAG: type IV toxin-antitoxin system AbiEi family antitoxin domain-containing protein [Actinomycetota bacterium]|nr:type IV toxin-antitoxin system AbiEi family antitoxin domain-containing protein [Actinomycetota bacterium]
MPTTPYDRLVELAADQHGFVRTEEAEAVGIRPDYLRRLAMKGRLERRAQGLYRLTALPVGPLDEYHEAVLAARGEGVVAGDAALALWGLADVNPREIEVVLPAGQRVRRTNDRRFRLRQRRLDPDQIDHVEGIPVLAPQVAIAEAIANGIEGNMAEQAIANARRRELVGELGAARLRVQLADRNARPHGTTARTRT